MIKITKKLTLFLVLLILFLGIFISGNKQVKADDGAINFNPNVTIPNSGFKHEDPNNEDAGKPLTKDTKPIADYIKAIYTYAISIVAIAAALALMIGGVIWLTAGGSNTRVESAKKVMTGALSGLVLALGSYFLLYQINPDLTKTQWFKIKGVGEELEEKNLGCCEFPDGRVMMLDKETCESDQYGDQIGKFVGYDYTKGETKCVKQRDYSIGGCLYDWDSKEKHWTNCVLRDEHDCKKMGEGFFADCKNEGQNNEVCSEFCGYDKVCDDNWGEDFCVPRE